MEHVIIAWGTGLVTVLASAVVRKSVPPVKEGHFGDGPDLFDGLLMAILLAGSVLSIYTLTQVDGNYFMLVYAVLGISAVRMAGDWLDIGRGIKRRTYPQSGAMPAGSSLFPFQRNDYLHYQLGGNSRLYPVKWTGKAI